VFDWKISFFSYFSSLRPCIQFNMEIVSGNAIPSLDALVMGKKTNTATRVCRELTHAVQYLSFSSNQPPYVKRGLIQSLHKRASTKYQEVQGLFNEISSLRRDLQHNGCPQGFIDSVINSKGSCRPRKCLWALCISHMWKGSQWSLKGIENRYNISKIFRPEHSLRSLMMKTWPEGDSQ
jgi:hypothetical protein